MTARLGLVNMVALGTAALHSAPVQQPPARWTIDVKPGLTFMTFPSALPAYTALVVDATEYTQPSSATSRT